MHQYSEKIIIRKVRDFGEVLAATTAFVRQNYGILFKSMVMIAFPFLLIGLVFTSLHYYQNFGTIDIEDFIDNPLLGTGAGTLFSVLAYIMSFIGYVMLMAALYAYVVLYEERTDFYAISLNEVATKAFSFLGLYTGTTIMLYLLLIALFIPLLREWLGKFFLCLVIW